MNSYDKPQKISASQNETYERSENALFARKPKNTSPEY